MQTIHRSIGTLLFALVTAACSDRAVSESAVFTLYSTNFPNEFGRYGIATFDLADTPETNSLICRETADLLQADFERRKLENGWRADVKMRHWCEKGRFKK